MKVSGIVASGVMRGEPLMEIYGDRLQGFVGFRPFPGTLNVKLEKKINIKSFSGKTVSHRLLHGRVAKELYIVHGKIMAKLHPDFWEDCWIMKQEKGPYKDDSLELIAKESLRDKLCLKDGDRVEVDILGDDPAPKAPKKKQFGRLHTGTFP